MTAARPVEKKCLIAIPIEPHILDERMSNRGCHGHSKPRLDETSVTQWLHLHQIHCILKGTGYTSA